MGTKLHDAAVALLAFRRQLTVGMYLPDNDATRSALEDLSEAAESDAAPDMLEALTQAVQAHGPFGDDSRPAWWPAACAAISKATGGGQ